MTLWWDQVVLASLATADGLVLFLSPYVKGPAASRPLVTTIHDLLFMLFPEFSSRHRRPRNALLKLMARWVSDPASRGLPGQRASTRRTSASGRCRFSNRSPCGSEVSTAGDVLLMISSDFSPISGGQSRYLFDLWSRLAAQGLERVRRGFDRELRARTLWETCR